MLYRSLQDKHIKQHKIQHYNQIIRLYWSWSLSRCSSWATIWIWEIYDKENSIYLAI